MALDQQSLANPSLEHEAEDCKLPTRFLKNIRILLNYKKENGIQSLVVNPHKDPPFRA